MAKVQSPTNTKYCTYSIQIARTDAVTQLLVTLSGYLITCADLKRGGGGGGGFRKGHY